MAIMHSKMFTLVRQDANQPWGFRLQGGSDYGRPLTVQKIGPGSISECRGLQAGDTILQIGRERTVDMTHQDAQDAVLRSANRLDLVVLRSVEQKETKKQEEPARITALVHNTYNSPIGLYSTENITNSLITQAQVLTNGTAVGANYIKAMNKQPVNKRSEVYRMVHEEEGKLPESPRTFNRDTIKSPTLQSQSFLKLERALSQTVTDETSSEEEEEEETSSSASPSPTHMRRPGQAPAAPPKPNVGWRDQGSQGHQPQQPQNQHPQYQAQPQQSQQQRPQPQQYQPQPQQYQPRPQQYQPQPQQYQQQKPQYQPQPQQQRPQVQQRPQGQPQPQPQQQRPQVQQQRPQAQQQQNQYDQNRYNATYEITNTQQNYYRQPTAPNAVQNNIGGGSPKPGSTFQSIIPVQSSTQQNVTQVTWSPTQERGLPVWPPQKNDAPIPTSSQSFKWSGSAGPSKKFIWPPPKDYVEITEEYEGDQRRTIYHHVKDPKPNPARVYVSPRSPARLAAEAWEPYSKEYREIFPPKRGYIGRNLRQFDDIFESNSTRLPPTYRAPPGTHYVPC